MCVCVRVCVLCVCVYVCVLKPSNLFKIAGKHELKEDVID